MLWLPSGERTTVEWYLSDGRASGVERISDDWVPHRVGDRRQSGFAAMTSPFDPDRDDFIAKRRAGTL